MSRYHTLFDEINLVLKYDKSGKAKWRQVRVQILKRIVRDLITIKLLPPNWNCLNNDHLFRLINHWRKQKLTESTITTYLAAIRYFFKNAKVNNNIASNTALGVFRKYCRSKQSIHIEDYHKILHPYIKCILGFEFLFGIHRVEAIKIRTMDNLLIDNKLWVSRNISFNGVERFVPIMTEEQNNLIELFKATLPKEQSMLDRIDQRVLMALYKAELATINLDSTQQHRKHYVKYRANILKDIVTPRQLKFMIKDEIGITSDNLIRKYLS